MYDWANSTFATTVLAGLFPLFFRGYYSKGQPAVVVTNRLAMASAMAIFVAVVLSPILGALADQGGWRKRALAGGMLLGSLLTAALAFIGSGEWLTAALVFAVANVGFSLANVASVS